MTGDLPLNVQTFKDATVVNFGVTSILDTALIDRLAKELYRLVDELDKRKIVLDFSEVRFLSSSALGMLLNLRRKACSAKGQVVVCGMREELYKIFKITSLHKLFEFYDTEEQALNAFGIYTTG